MTTQPDIHPKPVSSDSTTNQSRMAAVSTEARWFASVGSWFFVLFSGTLLAGVAWMKMMNPGETIGLFPEGIGGLFATPIGLTYVGAFGLFLALIQLALVSSGAIFTLIPSRNLKRAGHVILVAWAMLWLVNLVRLTMVSGSITIVPCAFVAVLTAATILRASLNWQGPKQQQTDDKGRPPYQDRMDRLVEYAQDLFKVDEDGKESDRKRREADGTPLVSAARYVSSPETIRKGSQRIGSAGRKAFGAVRHVVKTKGPGVRARVAAAFRRDAPAVEPGRTSSFKPTFTQRFADMKHAVIQWFRELSWLGVWRRIVMSATVAWNWMRQTLSMLVRKTNTAWARFRASRQDSHVTN